MAIQRSMLISRRGYGGFGDTYTAATMCSNIPAGDPYRVPGNQCVDISGNKYNFDANGNVVAAGMDTQTMLIYGGLALAAYFILIKK